MADHIARAVDDLLADGDEIIVTGTHLVLTRRSGGGPPRTVVTQQMTALHRTDTLDWIAEQILDDLQDMVIGTLHRPWPENHSGAGLHPRAEFDGDRIELAFAPRDDGGGIALPPFPVPPEPERSVSAG